MIIKFDKIKVNKVLETNSLRNVWLVYFDIACIYFSSHRAGKIERMLREQFPDCHVSATYTEHYDYQINVSFSDADEAFFLLWASDGVELI